ncbi:hypothetical protein D9M72_499430 [compost metagenome]
MMPFAFGEIYDWCLKDSLEKVLEICTSTVGVLIAFTASPIPTEVCVYAAALRMIPSKEKPV